MLYTCIHIQFIHIIHWHILSELPCCANACQFKFTFCHCFWLGPAKAENDFIAETKCAQTHREWTRRNRKGGVAKAGEQKQAKLLVSKSKCSHKEIVARHSFYLYGRHKLSALLYLQMINGRMRLAKTKFRATLAFAIKICTISRFI